MKRAIWLMVVGTLVSIGSGAPARADFIFNNFSASPPLFNQGTVVSGNQDAYEINATGIPNPTTHFWAMRFTSILGRPILAVNIGAFNFSGPGTMIAEFFTDGAGIPGTLISGSTISLVPNAGSTPGVLTGLYDPTPSGVLTAGTNFWLVVRANIPTLGGWSRNNSGAAQNTRADNTGSGFTTQGAGDLAAFQVFAVIPEPSSFVLGGLAVSSFVGYVWRRRKQAA